MSDPSRETEAANRARRGRNIAIAVALAAFVIIVYVVTVVNMGANVVKRPF